MIGEQVRLVPIVTEEMREMVFEKARQNNEGLLDPTHAVFKKGEIIGVVSVQVHCSSWWMDTRKANIRDSISVFQCLDSLLLDRGILKYLMPCLDTSPYFKLMERVGFRKLLGNWSLFVRDFKE